jgi:hypothetical protein
MEVVRATGGRDVTGRRSGMASMAFMNGITGHCGGPPSDRASRPS